MTANKDPLQSIWQDDLSGVLVPATDAISKALVRHEAGQRWRNLREYAAAVLVVAIFGFVGLKSDLPTMQAGALLVAIAAIFVATSLHFRSRGVAPHLDRESRNFYAAALIREHNMLRSIGFWYVLPFVPGYVLCRYAAYQAVPAGREAVQIAYDLLVLAAAALLIVWNLKRAAALKAEASYVLAS